MNIKLNQIQMDYLLTTLFKEKDDLKSRMEISKTGTAFLLNINDDITDEIRDWVNLQLQLRGFDLNYELTKEGKILDELNDLFYDSSIDIHGTILYGSMNELAENINRILVNWDPIGVGKEMANYEYKGYIPMIIHHIQNRQELVRYLEKIVMEDMDLDYDSHNEIHSENLKKVCDSLIQAYQNREKQN